MTSSRWDLNSLREAWGKPQDSHWLSYRVHALTQVQAQRHAHPFWSTSTYLLVTHLFTTMVFWMLRTRNEAKHWNWARAKREFQNKTMRRSAGPLQWPEMRKTKDEDDEEMKEFRKPDGSSCYRGRLPLLVWVQGKAEKKTQGSARPLENHRN